MAKAIKKTLLLLLFPSLMPMAMAEGPAAASTASKGLSVMHLAQVTIGLLIVVVVIFGLAYLIKRFGYLPSSNPGALKVIAGLMVGQRERAVLIQVGEKQILLGVASGLVKTLYVLEENIQIETPSAKGMGPFAEKLKLFLRDKGGVS